MLTRSSLIDLSPLRSCSPFRRLWIGRGFSSLGGQMTLIAVMFQIWQLTHSTIWTGAVGVAQAAPLIALGLPAGSLTDRTDRRRLYLITVAGEAACSTLLAVQAILGQPPPLAILGVLAVQSCFGAAAAPAARTFIPRLLPAGQITAGLALDRIAMQTAMLVGPALGGLTIGRFGVEGCYLIDAVTFGLGFSGAFGLPAMKPQGEPPRPGAHVILDGLRFLLRTSIVRGALLTDLATTVLSFPISLFPLINAERFGGYPRTLGLLLSALALGGVTASLFSGTFTRMPRPGIVMLCASGSWGAALVLFAIVTNRWTSLALLAVAGAADTASVISRSALVQLHTPDSLRGRVSAAEQIVGQAGPDIGNLRAGLVAGVSSGLVSLLSGGLLCVASVTAIGASTPALRRFVLPEPPRRAAESAATAHH